MIQFRLWNRWAAATALLAGGTSAADAHFGLHPGGGMLAGIVHPLTGADHVAAMATIGLIATRYGSVAWRLPLAFVTATAVGGVAGFASPSTFVEYAIGASLFGLLAWLAAGSRVPLGLGLGIAAAIGFLHGWAHGAERQADPEGLWFLAGMVVSTGLLHLAGLAAGSALNRLSGRAHKAGWLAVGGLMTVVSIAAVAS